jgi:hypothetical protein
MLNEMKTQPTEAWSGETKTATIVLSGITHNLAKLL